MKRLGKPAIIACLGLNVGGHALDLSGRVFDDSAGALPNVRVCAMPGYTRCVFSDSLGRFHLVTAPASTALPIPPPATALPTGAYSLYRHDGRKVMAFAASDLRDPRRALRSLPNGLYWLRITESPAAAARTLVVTDGSATFAPPPHPPGFAGPVSAKRASASDSVLFTKFNYEPRVYHPVDERETDVSVSLATMDPARPRYVGDTSLTDSSARSIHLAFDEENAPYVSFLDDARNGGLTVMRFQGGSWRIVGNPGFAPEARQSGGLYLGEDDGIYAVSQQATVNGAAKPGLWRYDGRSWVDALAPRYLTMDWRVHAYSGYPVVTGEGDLLGNVGTGAGSRLARFQPSDSAWRDSASAGSVPWPMGIDSIPPAQSCQISALQARPARNGLFALCSKDRTFTTVVKLEDTTWQAVTSWVNTGRTDGGVEADWYMDEQGAFYLHGWGYPSHSWYTFAPGQGWRTAWDAPSPFFAGVTPSFKPVGNVVHPDDGTALALGHLATPDSTFGLHHRQASRWALSAAIDIPKSRLQHLTLALDRRGNPWFAFGDLARGGRLSVVQLSP